MKGLLIFWIYTVMTMMVPLDTKQFIKEAQETQEQRKQRYEEIAEAVFDASFDPSEVPIFHGEYARSQTALFVTYKFYMESGFRKDIHLGLGRYRLGKQGWGDHGRSWCMGQIMLGRKPIELEPGVWTTESARTTPEGWYGTDLVGDTKKCAQTTLRMVRKSMGACAALPYNQRLSAYISGSCQSSVGKSHSEKRMQLFAGWKFKAWKRHPKLTDEQILQELTP